MALEGCDPGLVEVLSQYLCLRTEERQDKHLYKTDNILTETLTADLPNKGLKIHIYHKLPQSPFLNIFHNIDSQKTFLNMKIA